MLTVIEGGGAPQAVGTLLDLAPAVVCRMVSEAPEVFVPLALSVSGAESARLQAGQVRADAARLERFDPRQPAARRARRVAAVLDRLAEMPPRSRYGLLRPAVVQADTGAGDTVTDGPGPGPAGADGWLGRRDLLVAVVEQHLNTGGGESAAAGAVVSAVDG